MAKIYIAQRDLLVNGKNVKKGKQVRGIKKRNLTALINTGRIRVEEEPEPEKAIEESQAFKEKVVTSE